MAKTFSPSLSNSVTNKEYKKLEPLTSKKEKNNAHFIIKSLFPRKSKNYQLPFSLSPSTPSSHSFKVPPKPNPQTHYYFFFFFYICLKEVYGGGIRRLEAERAGRRTLLRRRVGGPHRLGDRRGSRHLRSLLGSWSVAFRTRCFGVVLLLAATATMIGVWGLRMVFFSVLRHVTTFLARRLPCRVSLLGVTR